MLRLLGIICLMTGCIGTGWSLRCRMKRGLEQLYQIRQIMKMFQSEITYSHVPLPEACRRIAGQMKAPYKSALLRIHEQMQENAGESFAVIWKRHIGSCLKELDMREEDGRMLYEFGDSVGFMDGKMQTEILEQAVYKLELAIDRQEKELANKCRVIMSLSVMGGLMIAIIFI